MNKDENPPLPKIFVTICHKKDQYPHPLAVTYFLNDPYDKFYQNMSEVFFMFKMNKLENHNLWNEHQNRNFQF